MMRKLLSLVLALALLCSLSACGGGDSSSNLEEKNSATEVAEALGYDLLEPEADGLTFSSAAVIDGVIGQAEYRDGDSTVTLRMTLDAELLDGLAGYENAGMAGGIEAPADAFSTLDVFVIGESIYYCEFSFTSNGYACYLSLAETKTDFEGFSTLLIDYVNQLYGLEDVPGFVYAIDPDFVLEEEEEEAEEETAASASLEHLQLEYNDITLANVGDSYTFSPTGGDGTYTWESADRSIAIVSPTGGTVTAVASGTTTVTCTSGDGQTAEVIVRVR
ncbi:MAG: Ig-like domain-containing protein [Clostridiales bacterium]|nr:Ig-like domain-containing protein [Clostridiales bacterium]